MQLTVKRVISALTQWNAHGEVFSNDAKQARCADLSAHGDRSSALQRSAFRSRHRRTSPVERNTSALGSVRPHRRGRRPIAPARRCTLHGT
jgi:hypothetical protein